MEKNQKECEKTKNIKLWTIEANIFCSQEFLGSLTKPAGRVSPFMAAYHGRPPEESSSSTHSRKHSPRTGAPAKPSPRSRFQPAPARALRAPRYLASSTHTPAPATPAISR